MNMMEQMKAMSEIGDFLQKTEGLARVVENLVISVVKTQITSEERDVDRMIGAIPERVVEDVMKKHEVPEGLIDLRRVLRIAKNHKKRLR